MASTHLEITVGNRASVSEKKTEGLEANAMELVEVALSFQLVCQLSIKGIL